MEINLNASPSLVYQSCIDILNNMDIQINYKNKSEGVIQASSDGSIFSWGEDIDIGIKSLSPQKTRVNVSSSTKSQLISWGKNEENERKIINALSKKFK